MPLFKEVDGDLQLNVGSSGCHSRDNCLLKVTAMSVKGKTYPFDTAILGYMKAFLLPEQFLFGYNEEGT